MSLCQKNNRSSAGKRANFNALSEINSTLKAKQQLGTMLHTCTPRTRRDILGQLYFAWFILTFIFCARSLLGVMPIHTLPRPVSRPCLVVGLNARHTGQGTNTHDLCFRSIMTMLVNYPLTLWHFCCKLHAVTFFVGTRVARRQPSATIKRHGILLLWVLGHKIFPTSLLTARLRLGIKHK